MDADWMIVGLVVLGLMGVLVYALLKVSGECDDKAPKAKRASQEGAITHESFRRK